jgi:rRNA maturation endonuclease Nob1
VLDLLSTCEQKLVLLAEDLSSHDLETVQKEMEDDEFRSKVETHIPADNIRIQLPKDASQSTMFRDDSDSGSDEEFVSREKMKMTAQALVEAKTKKKPSDDDDAAPKKRR